MFLGQKQNAISLVKKIREEVNDKIVRLYPDILKLLLLLSTRICEIWNVGRNFTN